MALEFEWKLASVEDLKNQVPNKELGDAEVKVDLATASVTGLVTPEEAGLTFALDAGVTATIEAFNSENDVDVTGVVGTSKGGGATPALLFAVGSGWLKYAARARVKAKAGFDVPYLAASGEVEAALLIADYRRHPLGEKIRDAVVADAKGLRVPFRADHVAALSAGDALAFQARTQLKASIKVSWSDVFAANLSEFASLLPAGHLIRLKTTLGASVAASVDLTDELLVAFTREDEGIVVTVKKASARTTKGTPVIGVSIETGDESAIDAVLEAAYEALLGRTTATQFEAAIDAWIAGNLSSDMKTALGFALERLGVDFDKADPHVAKQLWGELKLQIQGVVLDIAHQKIEAAFTYEYARISDDQVLAQFVVPEGKLSSVHRQLIVGNLGAALDHVGDAAVRRYLRQTSLKVSSAWGFALGFRDATLLEGKDAKSLRESVEYASRREESGPRRIAYQGTRSYRGSLFGVTGSWACDFKADMPELRSDPSAADFDYGIYLQIAHEGGLSGDGLSQVIDEAVVWRVFDDADAPEVAQAIQRLSAGGDATSRLELKIANPELRQILPLIAEGKADAFGRALARAMPWDSSTARRFVNLRQGHYDDLWFTYLTERAQDWTPERAASRTYEWLRKISLAKNYAQVEKMAGQNTLADVLDKNARTGQGKYSATYLAWQSTVAGAVMLRDAIAQRQHPAVFKTVFGRFEDLWTQSFHTKAFGALLIELGTALPSGMGAVEATLTVTAGQREALVFSTGRA